MNKGQRKTGVIFTSVLAIIIIVILGLYFFTDIFTEKETKDERANNNEAKNELVENNNAGDHQINESNKDETNTDQSDHEVANNTEENTPSNENSDTEGENELEEQLEIEPLSDKIITALANRDMETVAHYVDPEEGLLFSPYIFVTDEAVVFEKSEVDSMLDQDETYHWGDYDGKGTPIELTPAEYFDEFLEMESFENSDEVLIDNLQDRGNTLNNIDEVFPDARVIEYYNDGTEEYAGIDWQSVLLIYKEDEEGALHLIAIVRDMWTV